MAMFPWMSRLPGVRLENPQLVLPDEEDALRAAEDRLKRPRASLKISKIISETPKAVARSPSTTRQLSKFSASKAAKLPTTPMVVFGHSWTFSSENLPREGPLRLAEYAFHDLFDQTNAF